MSAQTTTSTMLPHGALAAGRHAIAPAPRALESIEGFPFPVRTSIDATGAGLRIARRALAAHDVLRRELGIAPRLSLRVLDRADWLRYADVDWYGTPHVSRDGDLVVGAEAADEWQDVSEYLARQLPSKELAALIAVHGRDPLNRRGPALDAIAESLIAHEIAHLLATEQRIVFPSRWLEEAFANYVLVVVLADTDPAGLRLVGSLAEAARALDRDLPTLQEFECGFGPMDAISSLLGELAITRSVYTAYARKNTTPLVDLFDALRASADPDADWELGRMLGSRIDPSIASIPDAFAVERVRLAA